MSSRIVSPPPATDVQRAGPSSSGRGRKGALALGVLGSLHAERHGSPVGLGGPKQRAVLAMLVAAHPHSVSLDRIVDEIWEAHPPRVVESSIHAYVSNLRSVLAAPIVRSGGAYRLHIDPLAIDANRFATKVERALGLIGSNPLRSGTMLRSALSLWRGQPYTGFESLPVIAREVRRLEALWLMALDGRITTDLALGRHAVVMGELESLVEDHPLHEGFCAHLMVALYRCGRQADALRVYHTARRHLVEQVGLDPHPGLQQLEMQILTHDPALLVSPQLGDARSKRIPSERS